MAKSWKEFGTSLAQSSISDLSSGMVSNLVSLPFNILYQQQALENDKDRMNHQASLNREQYMLEHSMESPIAMRANLEEANLNPALMYSQGGLASGMNASVGPSSSSTSAPHTAVPAKQTSLNNLLGLQRLSADIENVQADTEAKLAQAKYNRTLDAIADERREIGTNLLRAQWQNQEIRNDIDEIERMFAVGLNDANIDKIKAVTEDLRNQIINRDKTTAIDAKRANAYVDQVNAQIQKWKVDNAYTRAQTEGQKTENKFQSESLENRLRKVQNDTVISYYNALSAEDKQLIQKMDRIIQERSGGVNYGQAKTVAQLCGMLASTFGYDTWEEFRGKSYANDKLAEIYYSLIPGSKFFPESWRKPVIDFMAKMLE